MLSWGAWTLHHKKYSSGIHPWKHSTTLSVEGEDSHAQLYRGSPIMSPRTCSLVVRPLATSTTWNPVRPATGMKNKPATHITAILKQRIKENRAARSHCPQPLQEPPSPWPLLPQCSTCRLLPAPKPATHRRIRDSRADPWEFLHVVEDIKEAKAKHTHDVRCQGEEEKEEIAVVPATDTVVHPGAVMVKLLGTKRETLRSILGPQP